MVAEVVEVLRLLKLDVDAVGPQRRVPVFERRVVHPLQYVQEPPVDLPRERVAGEPGLEQGEEQEEREEEKEKSVSPEEVPVGLGAAGASTTEPQRVSNLKEGRGF